MKKVDFLIVGQGLAGTFLSWFLFKSGHSFMVVDDKGESSASQVAAGIIHPITGRRIVKTWMADTLLPFARKTYEEIESHFGTKIFFPLPVLELLSTAGEYNDWMSRSGDPEFQSYIESMDAVSPYVEYLNSFFKAVSIRNSSRIDIGALLSAFRKKLLREERLLEEKFTYDGLKLLPSGIEYKGIRASKVIFCEGAEALQNPYWKHLPFLPVKGEVLMIKAAMNVDHVLNRKIYILPVGKNLFKAGSTYVWNFKDSLPTQEAMDFLVAQLKSILKIPFEVLDHKAAIRPAARNRRPFLGIHPAYPQVGIFNGLGTKGCLLAPWFAKHYTDYLLGKSPLMDEVNIRMLKNTG